MRRKAKKVARIDVRDGYNLWSHTYDNTATNPLIALDERYTMNLLRPKRGERILDAACGTGRNLKSMRRAGSRPIGLDFSRGMLTVARHSCPKIPLVEADLEQPLPIKSRVCDAVLCALVGEHLTDLRLFFEEVLRLLTMNARFVFSVFHPEMAAAGIEANFEHSDIEYRLGAVQHTADDYLNHMADAGFRELKRYDFCGDDELARTVPKGRKYLNSPLLLVIEGQRAG